MAYLRNQPVATDNLDVSQPILFTNTNSCDDSFGVDHYKFSDLTANNGKHNQVTTPVHSPVGNPLTGADEPKLYAVKQTVPLGAIQYSMPGGNTGVAPFDLVPTPLTVLQSTRAAIPIAPAAVIPVLDFTGLPRAMGTLHILDNTTPRYLPVGIAWTGVNILIFGTVPVGTFLVANGNVSTLEVKNVGALARDCFWTLHLVRTE